jgi:nanoRNase/pAp phosphatase (c-di-AMP/oligoRNAs hydrolase)
VDDLVRQAGREKAVPLSVWDAVRPVDLVIDHHATNRGYGRLNWIEPERSAVSEMVLDLLRLWEDRTGTALVDQQAATWLFVGLATSTDWFTRDTGDHTWEAARFLDARGRLDKAAIASKLNTRSPGYFRLSGALRGRATVIGGVARVAVAREDLERFGVAPADAAEFIDELRALPAAIYLVFVDLGAEGIRVRLRSDVLPVHRLAQAFGGGGHERAAGAVLPDAAAVAALITAAEAAVREAEPGAGTDGNHWDAPERDLDGGPDGARARDSRGGRRGVSGPGQRT